MSKENALTAGMKADLTREVGGVRVDVGRAGNVRVKRMIYPAGFSWDKDLCAVVGSEYCQHAHRPGEAGMNRGDSPI